MDNQLLWPAESLAEFKARLELPFPERNDPMAIVKDYRFPPGDVRRYIPTVAKPPEGH